MIISFSGGRTSAMMTTMLIEKAAKGEIEPISAIVFANTGKERNETLNFVNECDKMWGGVVTWLEYDRENGYKIVNYDTASRSGEPFRELIEKKKFLPNSVMRFCTIELKIKPIEKYIKSLGLDLEEETHAIGIRFDEPSRYYKLKESRFMPLYEWRITKKDVDAFWSKMPFNLQLKRYEGNCDLCFLKGKKLRIQILRDNPQVAKFWAEMEVIAQGTFDKSISIVNLLKMSEQPLLFDELEFDDDIIPCACNVD